MADPKIKFGILGCGTIASFHATGIRECPSAELVAVCDVEIQRAEEFAKQQGIETAFGDIRDMTNCPEVDAICVCTPSGLHLEAVLTCVDAKKHVLIEKPLEITTARIDRIAEAVIHQDVKVGAIFQLRYSPALQKVKKALVENVLGSY